MPMIHHTMVSICDRDILYARSYQKDVRLVVKPFEIRLRL